MKDKSSKVYKKRKKNAQFFTPTELVRKIIEESEIEFRNKRILEPSCGDGAFIEQLVGENEIFAVDKDKQKTKYIKEEFDDINVITKDFLTYNPKLKFDIVIGNPPFNLSTKLDYIDTTEGFVCHAIDLLEDNGYMIFVLPNTILRNKKYQNLRKKILDNMKIIKIMDTRNNDFLGADIETITIFLKKEKVEKQVYTYLSNGKEKTIYLNRNVRDTIRLNNDEISNEISNIVGKKKLNELFEIYRGNSNAENALKGKDIDFYNDTFLTEEEDYCIGLQNIAYRLVANVIKASDNKISDTITILKPKEKMNYKQLCYIANYLDTPIAHYMIHVNAFNNSKLTMHIDKYYIEDMTIPDISDLDYKEMDKFINSLDKVRNNKEFAQIRNKYFYSQFDINNLLKDEIETMWQLPKYKVKRMEKIYDI